METVKSFLDTKRSKCNKTNSTKSILKQSLRLWNRAWTGLSLGVVGSAHREGFEIFLKVVRRGPRRDLVVVIEAFPAKSSLDL